MPHRIVLSILADERKLEDLRAQDSDVDLQLIELNRVLKSETFKPLRDQTKGFLRFVVYQALLGRADQIKETTIGVYVYALPPNFDPKVRTTVRVAAGGLRERLHKYYGAEGASDPVRIELPRGTYVPVFHQRWPTVTVNQFKNLNPSGDDEHTVQMIRAEIIDRLKKFAQCRVQMIPLNVSGTHFEINASCCRAGASLEVYAQIVDRPSKEIIKTVLIRDNRANLIRLADDLYTQLYARIRETIPPDVVVTPGGNSAG